MGHYGSELEQLRATGPLQGQLLCEMIADLLADRLEELHLT